MSSSCSDRISRSRSAKAHPDCLSKGFPKRDQARNDRLVLDVAVHRPHDADVELDDVRPELQDVSKAGVTGPGVIYGEHSPLRTQRRECGAHCPIVSDGVMLRDLQHEGHVPARRNSSSKRVLRIESGERLMCTGTLPPI